jgi:hypothetical protein
MSCKSSSRHESFVLGITGGEARICCDVTVIDSSRTRYQTTPWGTRIRDIRTSQTRRSKDPEISLSIPEQQQGVVSIAEESPAVVPLDPRKFCLACTSPKSCAPDQFPLWKKHLHARATLV